MILTEHAGSDDEDLPVSVCSRDDLILSLKGGVL